MNKYQEAFEYIKNYCELDDDCIRWPLYHKSIKALKELVDKATPKKPIKHLNSFYRCVSCDELFQNYHYQNCCPNCGQKLDWSEAKYETD